MSNQMKNKERLQQIGQKEIYFAGMFKGDTAAKGPNLIPLLYSYFD